MSACLGISVCSCVSVLVCGEEGMGTGEKKKCSAHTEYIELDRVSVESFSIIRRHVTFVHCIISRVFPAEDSGLINTTHY